MSSGVRVALDSPRSKGGARWQRFSSLAESDGRRREPGVCACGGDGARLAGYSGLVRREDHWRGPPASPLYGQFVREAGGACSGVGRIPAIPGHTGTLQGELANMIAGRVATVLGEWGVPVSSERR